MAFGRRHRRPPPARRAGREAPSRWPRRSRGRRPRPAPPWSSHEPHRTAPFRGPGRSPSRRKSRRGGDRRGGSDQPRPGPVRRPPRYRSDRSDGAFARGTGGGARRPAGGARRRGGACHHRHGGRWSGCRGLDPGARPPRGSGRARGGAGGGCGSARGDVVGRCRPAGLVESDPRSRSRAAGGARSPVRAFSRDIPGGAVLLEDRPGRRGGDAHALSPRGRPAQASRPLCRRVGQARWSLARAPLRQWRCAAACRCLRAALAVRHPRCRPERLRGAPATDPRSGRRVSGGACCHRAGPCRCRPGDRAAGVAAAACRFRGGRAPFSLREAPRRGDFPRRRDPRASRSRVRGAGVSLSPREGAAGGGFPARQRPRARRPARLLSLVEPSRCGAFGPCRCQRAPRVSGARWPGDADARRPEGRQARA